MGVRRNLAVLLGAVVLAAVVSAPSAAASPPTSQADTQGGTSTDDMVIPQGWSGIDIAQGYNNCPRFYFCVWENNDARGRGRGYGGTISCGDWWNWEGGWLQNNASSVYNRTTIDVALLAHYANGQWLPMVLIRKEWTELQPPPLGYFYRGNLGEWANQADGFRACG